MDFHGPFRLGIGGKVQRKIKYPWAMAIGLRDHHLTLELVGCYLSQNWDGTELKAMNHAGRLPRKDCRYNTAYRMLVPLADHEMPLHN